MARMVSSVFAVKGELATVKQEYTQKVFKQYLPFTDIPLGAANCPASPSGWRKSLICEWIPPSRIPSYRDHIHAQWKMHPSCVN